MDKEKFLLVLRNGDKMFIDTVTEDEFNDARDVQKMTNADSMEIYNILGDGRFELYDRQIRKVGF